MRYALSYAAQQVSGLWSWVRDTEHVEKAFDFAGMGARNGVTAALMAQAGSPGSTMFDGEHNVSRRCPRAEAGGDGRRPGHPVLRQRNGDQDFPWVIRFRRRSTLPDAAARAQPDGRQRRRIVVRLPADRATIVDNQRHAGCELPDIIAVALIDGTVSFDDSHSHERMEDPGSLPVKARVQLVADRH